MKSAKVGEVQPEATVTMFIMNYALCKHTSTTFASSSEDDIKKHCLLKR